VGPPKSATLDKETGISTFLPVMSVMVRNESLLAAASDAKGIKKMINITVHAVIFIFMFAP
jgi:hypothetical protein